MKRTLSFVLLTAITFVSIAIHAEEQRAESNKIDAALTEKIKDALTELAKIKAGMTRAELLKIVATEGGISTRTGRRYVYTKCPYIKVDVEFEIVDDVERFGESSKDKIVKISKPFLEWSIAD